jgi:soluble lytic murein transglycosylase
MLYRTRAAAFLGWACLTLIAAPCSAGTDEERAQFKRAYQAMVNGRVEEARRLGAGLEHYPLYPYLAYEYLTRRLHHVAITEVREFLAASENTWAGDRLRTQWLTHLARRQRWHTFIEDYRPQEDVKLQCTHLLARIRTGATEGIVQDAIGLWLVGRSQPEECDPAFERLYASPAMTDELLWQRIRLAMAEGEAQLAGWLGRRLPAADQPWVTLWREAHANPAVALGRTRIAEDNGYSREIVGYALARMSRRDLPGALRHWRQLESRYAFDASERGRIVKTLALAAARQDRDEAAELLDEIPAEELDAEVQGAMLRTAIRTHSWNLLARWTEHDAIPDLPQLQWRYWRARALEQIGDKETALAIYRLLAGERDYYGFRAADRLGTGYNMIDRPLPYTPEQINEMRLRPGIHRAAEFHALGYVYYARREWHYEIARMGREDLEKAAKVADEMGWFDRSIITLSRAESYDDLALRFPTPFASLIETYARKRDLSAALLFSIIRAESAFMEDARSPAGALGLMQVMPATGREVAKRIGFRLDNAQMLLQARANVTLGTAYLKQMLESYGGNVAMAAAAYNAGPHRVHSWRPQKACQAAEDWIELIPFTETRHYVRRALFYTAIYEWRLAREVQPLQLRMAAVPARGSRSTASC